ncbi:MAG: alpha-L-arabinofuranosidase [Ktedonobacteraceae bacterium]
MSFSKTLQKQDTRREWIRKAAAISTATALPEASAHGSAAPAPIIIDPAPLFDISPHLYEQFMEPLGVTDSSVEACWDYTSDDWREDFVDVVRDLAPGVIRFGGDFSRYYKWREGVGPVEKRPWMRNYSWGGKETNRVGTDEFVGFCRRVGAEPLYCVNFESDGIEWFKHTPEGNRSGTAIEAADWVSYANDPDSKERKGNGVYQPYNIKLWQIGNETSYLKNGFSKAQAIAHTIAFAKAMRQRDPSIQLIGWGDKKRGKNELWAVDMLRDAGDYLNYVAIHMGRSPRRQDTVLSDLRYQADPERAWHELLDLSNTIEGRITELENAISSQKSSAGIAVTEGHLSLKPHNMNHILFEWLSAVYHARSYNIYQRHGARVKIAAAADFNGNRWSTLAVRAPAPRGKSFLMPVGSIARLFKGHNGEQGVGISSAPSSLDIAAARTGNRLFLHVLNLEFRQSVEASFVVHGRNISAARIFEIAPDNLRQYVNQDQPNVFMPIEKTVTSGEGWKWRFPAGSVTAVELDLGV